MKNRIIEYGVIGRNHYFRNRACVCRVVHEIRIMDFKRPVEIDIDNSSFQSKVFFKMASIAWKVRAFLRNACNSAEGSCVMGHVRVIHFDQGISLKTEKRSFTWTDDIWKRPVLDNRVRFLWCQKARTWTSKVILNNEVLKGHLLLNVFDIRWVEFDRASCDILNLNIEQLKRVFCLLLKTEQIREVRLDYVLNVYIWDCHRDVLIRV